MAKYKSIHTGPQIDSGVSRALNPDTVPTAGSSNLITSGGTKSALSTFVRPNLLDNWYFVGGGSQQGDGVFPINQRGQSSYSGEGNTIDRWYSTNGLTVQSSYINLPNVQTSFGQRIIKTLTNGLTLTFSAFTDRGMKTGTIVNFDSSVNQQYWVIDDDVALYYDSLGTGIAGQFTIFNKYANCHIIAAKLEIGHDQTLAHQENGVWVLNEIPNYQQELAKCRYYLLYNYRVLWQHIKQGGTHYAVPTGHIPRMRENTNASNTTIGDGYLKTITGENGASISVVYKESQDLLPVLLLNDIYVDLSGYFSNVTVNQEL